MNNVTGTRIKEYTASAINTEGLVYEKIMASGAEARSQQGAIEQQINDLFAFLEEYRESDIFLHQGLHLQKSLNFFSGLRKSREESFLSFIPKYRAMMIRVGENDPLDTVWGTKWNIEHALRYYFNNDNCFVMEYTNDKEKNLFKSSIFASDTWEVDGVGVGDDSLKTVLSKEASVLNVLGIRLAPGRVLKYLHNLPIKGGVYSLHFFMRGQYKNTKGEWEGATELSIIKKGQTGNAPVFVKEFNCGLDWENKQETIKLEEGEYQLFFTGKKQADIDFVCLFPAVSYPSISILIGHGGMRSKFSMFFAPGEQDVEKDAQGAIAQYYEPPYKGTHHKFKFWFPNQDDTSAEAKQERKKNKLQFSDQVWGYWTEDRRWLDEVYIGNLLAALLPVGVKMFNLIGSRKGS